MSLHSKVIYPLFLFLAFFWTPELWGSNATIPIEPTSPVPQMTRIYPKDEADSVGRYEKLELGINLPYEIDRKVQQFSRYNKGGLNPFDPKAISIKAEFTHESNQAANKSRFAFYYLDFKRDLKRNSYLLTHSLYDWRIRFSPSQIGNWEVKVSFFVEGKEVYEPLTYSFYCKASDHKGYVQRSYTGTEKDRYFTYSGNGKTFHPIGHSISLPAKQKAPLNNPSTHLEYQEAFKDIAQYGANFARIEMGRTSWLPNWDSYNNYNSRMHIMWEFDKLLDLFAELEMYFMTYRHHIEIWDGYRWDENPFKTALGMTNQDQYFSDSTALEWQKNASRYMFSRWGYSSNWMSYSYSEVDNWIQDYGPEKGNWNDPQSEDWDSVITVFRDWMQDEKDYYQKELGYEHILFTATFGNANHIDGNDDPIFEICDFTGTHQYGETKGTNFFTRYDTGQDIWEKHQKPYLFEELGYNGGENDRFLNVYCCNGIGFHNEIWSCSFMGSAGTGLNFWWDRGLHLNEYYKEYAPLAAFFEGEDPAKWAFTPQRWKDAVFFDRAHLENYALVSENKEFAMGWVHNASYYWRNMAEIDPCMKELIDSAKISDPCTYPDGWQHKGTPHKNEFLAEGYEDVFTKSGGARPIENEIGSWKNPKFKIDGLKTHFFRFVPGSKRHWYKVEFYSTKTAELVETQILATNVEGELKPFVPNLNHENPDYSYKVYYLGFQRKIPD